MKSKSVLTFGPPWIGLCTVWDIQFKM